MYTATEVPEFLVHSEIPDSDVLLQKIIHFRLSYIVSVAFSIRQDFFASDAFWGAIITITV